MQPREEGVYRGVAPQTSRSRLWHPGHKPRLAGQPETGLTTLQHTKHREKTTFAGTQRPEKEDK